MRFELNNSLDVFSRILVKAFQEFIYKIMAIYFDDWMIYNMIKNHIHWLRKRL
jgi:hypothetical protein